MAGTRGTLASHSPAIGWGGWRVTPKCPPDSRSSGAWGARPSRGREAAWEAGEERATASADGQLASHNITL